MNINVLGLGTAAVVLSALGIISWRWYDGQQHLLNARTYSSQQNAIAAIPEYTTAIELLRDNEIYAERGTCLAMAGRDRDAITDLTVALALNPKNTNALIARGGAYLSAGEPEAALADLDNYIAIKPASRAAFRLRALAFARMHKYDLAVKDSSVVLKYRPRDKQALEIRSYALWQSDHYKESAEDLTTLSGIAPGSGVFLLRGSCYKKLGQAAAARADFKQALAMDPHSAAAAFNLKALGP